MERLHLTGLRVLRDHHQAVVLLKHLAGEPADEPDPEAPRPLVVLLVTLAVCPDVVIEDGDLDIGVLLPDEHGVLHRVHAADTGAVGAADGEVAGADALDERYAPGWFAVGEAL
ncbi:hypothetical protein ES707_16865 [subsurface metagenome]